MSPRSSFIIYMMFDVYTAGVCNNDRWPQSAFYGESKTITRAHATLTIWVVHPAISYEKILILHTM